MQNPYLPKAGTPWFGNIVEAIVIEARLDEDDVVEEDQCKVE